MTTSRPTLFLLHALGLSRRSFDDVAARLDAFEIVSIDLPGFGDASPALGTSVEEMANYVIRIIAESKATQWLIIGHSMGGKIASIVASRTLDGEPELFGLRGVVLLAGSPPMPEPMEESRRETMLNWMQSGTLTEATADEFIKANTGASLTPARHALAMHELMRATREAWLAWLERGSREDWSAHVGVLDIPALIIAGEKDADLGPQGQRNTNARVYPDVEILVLEGAAHFLPLERPAEVAEAVTRFWNERADIGPVVPESHARLIASDRVSRRTRGILARRALGDAPHYKPKALSAQTFATLRAITARVIPQEGAAIDLAARLDQQLAGGAGDGWRFADLPSDIETYNLALTALKSLDQNDGEAQDKVLAQIAAGDWHTAGTLSAGQMQHWFEDLRADLVRLWLAHPATMAAIGFDGFANGGDGLRKQGFTQLGAGEREAWESAPKESIV